jgi:L-cystine transport system substrate-binding protein
MAEVSMLRRRLVLAQLLALSGLVGTGARAAVPEAGLKMRVGFLQNYEPFSFVGKDGQLQGFDVDVHAEMCRVMGWEFEPVVGSLAELRRKLQDNAIDGIGNQLLRSTENRRAFDFVRPAYASIQLCAVQHEDDDRDFLSLEDLVGKKLGVLAQTGVEDQARGVLGKGVSAYPKIELAFQDLAARRLDVVLEENLIADYRIERDGLPLKVMSPFMAPMAVGLAVRKGHQVMLDRWSLGVSTVLKSGALAKISKQWFGYDVSRPRVSAVLSD